MRRGFQTLRRSGAQPNPFSPGNTRTANGSSIANKPTTSVSNTTLPSVKNDHQLSGEPMDFSMQKGNPFANKPEMNRRRAEGLCLGCDGAGYFLANCPTRRPSNKPLQGHAGQLLFMPPPVEGYVLESENEMSLGSVAPRDN